MTIAAALDHERQRQSLSLNELAKRSGQSFGRVHSVLNGKTKNPSIGTVRDLLRGLGKSLAWLGKQID